MQWKRAFIALTFVALVVACGGVSAPPATPDASVEGGTCQAPGVSAQCSSCLNGSCSVESATASVDCRSVISCYCACPLGDSCCIQACGSNVTLGCLSGVGSLRTCAATNCAGECTITAPESCSSEGGAPDAAVDGTIPDSGASDTGAADSPSVRDAPADTATLDAPAEAGEAGPPPPTGTCNGGSLLMDCSFESTTLAAGALQNYSSGQTFGAWTVVGATGNVAAINTMFAQNGFTFEAENGVVSLDLTGTTDTMTGVAQTVTTAVGAQYQLAFWVGNIVDPGGIFGTTSTVQVQINGTNAYSATNSAGTGTMTLDWQEFSFTFTATSTSTTIAFINGDPSNDTSNFIDNVWLVLL
jgi:hypothetical protein